MFSISLRTSSKRRNPSCGDDDGGGGGDTEAEDRTEEEEEGEASRPIATNTRIGRADDMLAVGREGSN